MTDLVQNTKQIAIYALLKAKSKEQFITILVEVKKCFCILKLNHQAL